MDAGERQTEFVDLQKPPPLEKTEYLKDELKRNWENTFTMKTFNEESVFADTKASRAAYKALWYKGWVTLCGSVGDGRTITAHHLLVQFSRGPQEPPKEESFYSPWDNSRHQIKWEKIRFKKYSIKDPERPPYRVVICKTPEDWKTKVKFNQRQIVLIDNIFGRSALNISRMRAWRPYLEEIFMSAVMKRPQVLVIITVDKYHLEKGPEDISQLELFRPGVMIDFTSGPYKYTSDDKQSILLKNSRFLYHHMSDREMNELRYSNVYEGVGIVCRMFGQSRPFQMEGHLFFQNPWSYVEKAIDKVYRFDKIMYYTLCVGVLLDGVLQLNKHSVEEYDERTQNIMKTLIPILQVPADVDLSKMRYACTRLNGFFLIPTHDFAWKFSHERILHLCAQSFSRKSMKTIIEHCSLDFLMDRLRTSTYFGSTNESVLNVFNIEYQNLAQRMTFELLSGHVGLVAQHFCCADDVFVKKWVEFMRQMGSLAAATMMRGELNRSFFYWCCYFGQGAMVKAMLEEPELIPRQAEDWFKDEMKWGLQAACAVHFKSAPTVVKALLDKGVGVNTQEDYQGEDVVEVFGKEMAYMMKMECTPIHVAARLGHPDTVKYLIEKGADVSSKGKDHYTPLHRASMRKKGDAPLVIKVLLDSKADINVKTPTERKPIHEAFTSGCLKTVQVLLDGGADVKENMDDGRSFISIAAQNDQKDLVEFLLNKGCHVNGLMGKDNYSPLHHAIGNDNKELVDFLLSKGHAVSFRSNSGWTPLHMATFLGHTEMMLTLLYKGADANETAYDQKTPLHIAAMQGDFEHCDILLDFGAKPEMMTSSNEPPVVLAAKGGHMMVAHLLLKEGMELEKSSDGDMYPFFRGMMF